MKMNFSFLFLLFICCLMLLVQDFSVKIESISEFCFLDLGEIVLDIYLYYDGFDINEYILFKVIFSLVIDDFGN